MMMNHRYILFTGLMVTALCIHAQDIELQTKEKYEYADATQLWRRTLNPAGLSLDTLTNRGISYFEFSHQQGTHYRVQDGDEQNKLLFTSERYQKIGKYLYGYGRFHQRCRRCTEKNDTFHEISPFTHRTSLYFCRMYLL